MSALLGYADNTVARAGLDEAALRTEQDVAGTGGLQRREPERYGAVLRVHDGKTSLRIPCLEITE